MSRTGRRPDTPETREVILAAARHLFATHGYDATSLRAISSAAEVDPALLIHYFGTKEGLFIAAADLPAPVSEIFADVISLPSDQAAELLVRRYLEVVDSEHSRNTILALVRSAVSSDKAASMLRGFLSDALLDTIEKRPGEGDPRLRASLLAAQLVGIAMLRHVLCLPPLAEASPDEIAEAELLFDAAVVLEGPSGGGGRDHGEPFGIDEVADKASWGLTRRPSVRRAPSPRSLGSARWCRLVSHQVIGPMTG